MLFLLVSGMAGIALVYNNKSNDYKEFYVVAEQFRYVPNQIKVTLNTKVRLILTSSDVTHGFELPQFGIYNVQILVGQNTTVEFTANQVGQFQFYCTVFCGAGHADHYGSLTVSRN